MDKNKKEQEEKGRHLIFLNLFFGGGRECEWINMTARKWVLLHCLHCKPECNLRRRSNEDTKKNQCD
jgi:hypothetical protein